MRDATLNKIKGALSAPTPHYQEAAEASTPKETTTPNSTLDETTRRSVLDAMAAVALVTGNTPDERASSMSEETTDAVHALLKSLHTPAKTQENTQENASGSNISEGFSMSVSTLDVMGKVYDAIARSHFQVIEAVEMARGQEGTSLSPDANKVLQNSLVHLTRARDEIYKAMRSVMPDVEYHGYRDMSV